MPFLGLILGRRMDPMEHLLSFLKTVPLLTPCLVKLFRLCLSTSTFPSSRKYAHVQPVRKKGDSSNPSNYRPIDLISCLSKAFETILNRKFLKHLSSFNLLSDHQYGFRKRRSTGEILAFLTVASDIPKAFDRVWHKALLFKLPSYGFYPALCSFLPSFLSGRSIAAAVDGHCFISKHVNSGVPLSFYYSSMIFFP